MNVGINATFWGMTGTGSGQYLYHLRGGLQEVAASQSLTWFLPTYNAHSAPAMDAAVVPLRTPFDRYSEGLAKVWFEQMSFPHGCAAHKVDVAHVPYFAPPLRSFCPTVVTIHDLIPLRLPEYRASTQVRLYMRLVSRAAREATLVLTDSQASARDIVELLQLPSERVRVIYLAAGDAFRPLSADSVRPLRDRLQLQRPYLLYLGGFDRRKRVPELLRAFAGAERAIRDVELVLAGQLPAVDTPFAPDPRVLVRELGLEERVRFIGWIAEEDKPALFSAARGFIFPSVYEGFGLPVLEALACGTPAIVASGTSLEEVAGAGALVVPPDDVNALARALIQLAHDDPLRQELSQEGLAQASTFSWYETARQTVLAYQEALSLPPISQVTS